MPSTIIIKFKIIVSDVSQENWFIKGYRLKKMGGLNYG